MSKVHSTKRARPVAAAVLWFFLILALPCLIIACTASQKKAAKTALDYADTLCILAHAERDVKMIQTACAIEEIFAPQIERTLAAHQSAMQREAAAKRPAASASASSAPGASAWPLAPAPSR